MGEVEDLRESSDEAERKFRRMDSLDVESGTVPDYGHDQDERARFKAMLNLAFQNFGVVFGDIGMSPLYVYSSTFREGSAWHPDDILGILSLILYSFTLIPLLKYVFFVMNAMDNGEGGAFGLYSLLCCHVNIGLIPSDQQCHETNQHRSIMASCLKSKLENSCAAKILLLLATMLSTSMAITHGFFSTSISGISVVFVMILTSSFLVLIMIMIWKTHILVIISYVLTIGLMEFLYLSSVLYNIDQGGYLPFVFSGFLMTIMYIWNYVHRRKYFYELEHKISPKKFKNMIVSVNRIPGLALFYSEHVQDIPPIFKHYLSNVHALQRVLIFVTFKSLPMCKVSIEQQFVFRRVKPNDINVFRCVVRYGYRDMMHEQESFENVLVESLRWFIKESCMLQNDDGGVEEKMKAIDQEMEVVEKAWKDGIVHLIGENEVVASKESGLAKRVLINYVYDALRRNMRQSEQVCYIPCKRRLKVGMTYEL